ncbi:MAG: sigma-54 interaction domain-containing protein [Bacteroidota bacterium]
METDLLKKERIQNSERTIQPGEKPVFITKSQIMLDLYSKVKLIAKTNATVLITGDNGTGKEVFARLLHYHSKRSNQPMVVVNCGAIPADLVESELFGHEKGAFTGADSRKLGCFELADKGVLFLDEIGEMSLNAQVKLLRAVETGTFRRVGGKEEVKVDVTLISATNKILSDQVKSGSFREDLYYRLNVIELYIPPLKHRKEDISLLMEFYKNYFCGIYGVSDVVFEDKTVAMMMNYNWPGNIRELKNCIERCMILMNGRSISPDVLPTYISRSEDVYEEVNTRNSDKYIHLPVGMTLEEIEKQAIKQTLQSVGNNKTEAAKILGFARKTLHNKLEKYAANINMPGQI